MDIQNKISEYKSLASELIDCYEKMEKALKNHSADLEEIHLKILKLHEALDKCYQEIRTMRG